MKQGDLWDENVAKQLHISADIHLDDLGVSVLWRPCQHFVQNQTFVKAYCRCVDYSYEENIYLTYMLVLSGLDLKEKYGGKLVKDHVPNDRRDFGAPDASVVDVQGHDGQTWRKSHQAYANSVVETWKKFISSFGINYLATMKIQN